MWEALLHLRFVVGIAAVTWLAFSGDLMGAERAFLLVVAGGLTAMSGFASLFALLTPRRLRLEPPGDVPHAFAAQNIAAQLEALGFAPGPELRVALMGHIELMPWLHRDYPIYALVQEFHYPKALAEQGEVPLVNVSLVSVCSNAPGALTTSSSAEAAMVTLTPFDFRQVFVGAPALRLLDEHVRALSMLEEQGVAFADVSPGAFREHMELGFRVERQAFLRRPLTVVAAAAWRSLRKASPHHRRLEQQPDLDNQLHSYNAARTAGALSADTHAPEPPGVVPDADGASGASSAGAGHDDGA